ncbi:MAG TPA: hypothetical protein ENH94_08000 [Phycisphaerales bacterium]|nr:hypothetical protein [Phycisphaerales bacterium]
MCSFREEDMAETKNRDNRNKLSSLFQRINGREAPAILRREASRLITTVKPKDIAQAERDLVDIGFTVQLARQLSATFMMMGLLEKKDHIRTILPANHILHLVLVEHDMLRIFVAELKDLANTIVHLDSLSNVSSEFCKLTHVTSHLHAMKEHFDRENDVIFPFLRKLGWSNLCDTEYDDHEFITLAINDLIKLIGSFDDLKLETFKSRLITITGCFCPTMSEHITREDMLLYPIAFEAIKDPGVWKKMKSICDDIGYCGTHI